MLAVQTATTTMQVHDELAALLARNLTLGPVSYSMPVSDVSQQTQAPVPIQAPAAPAAPAPAPAAPVEQPKIVYSISQHYHHSAHIPKPTVHVEPAQQPVPEPEPTPEQVLVQNGIDPTALTDVQIALFKMSAPDRRDYLLQLWRICPPTRSDTAVTSSGPWDTIDVEMDKEIASSELRVQQSQSQQAASTQAVMSLDGTVVDTTESAPTQAADGRWTQSPQHSYDYMEPYMASGYEELARREYMASASASPSGYGNEASIPRTADTSGAQLRYAKATDPVYDNRLSASGRASWPQAYYSTPDMENQYGALMAMRDCGDMEM